MPACVCLSTQGAGQRMSGVVETRDNKTERLGLEIAVIDCPSLKHGGSWERRDRLARFGCPPTNFLKGVGVHGLRYC